LVPVGDYRAPFGFVVSRASDLNIDLRDIRLFVAAYEERSFTAAAKREFTTQPGISQHIRKIEDRLDTQLFTRGSTSIEPTPAGDLYYKECSEILRLYANVLEELKNYEGGLSGEIRIGLMQTMTRSVLAQTLAGFMDQHPNVRVRIFEGFVNDLVQRTRAGELDFAIVPAFAAGVHSSGIKSHKFVVTPEFLISKRTDSRQTLTPIRLADLSPVRMLLPYPGSRRRERLENYLGQNKIVIEKTFELDASFAWHGLVARTDWVAILPGLMLISETEWPELAMNPIIDPPFMLELVRIESSSAVISAAAETFYEHLISETNKENNRLLELIGA
jgi:LysR family nitrogen assimilation transcriptional regulator